MTENFPIVGTWEGSLEYVKGKGLRNPDWPPETWRLIIGDSAVQVFNVSRNDKEVKPGKFAISRYRTNTLIFAMDSGKDEDGTWVETESFVLTAAGPSILNATLSGAVNNVDLPREQELSSFLYVAIGQFRRV
ncbi:hypothetical protein [Bradyrhizobium brasilense]|uniref:hypothetical protein n=1 Tax=Bradyrhizobium brasilense TaxID=1419277 RepID=UPI001E486543|nr:hypothetical protein [Bradyrhizobium brasilense]MCC8969774.1 hypothetical protein [Bradyrhizobium brasilense]